MTAVKRLLIVADDLTGAADCAAAFAQRGWSTYAVIGAEPIELGDWGVLALDTDSRDLPPARAEEVVRGAVDALDADCMIFKKVDSTLRGNLAAELRATIAGRRVDCVIAAPAFPATGRTTRAGRQLLNGRPLEAGDVGDQVSSSALLDHLAHTGLAVAAVSLEHVRSGRMAEFVLRARAGGGELLICDAETEGDLEAIARGGLAGGADVVWLGSAGLARALCALLPAPSRPSAAGESAGGRPVLLVVGSPAAATRAQLARLRADPDAAEVVLGEGPDITERDVARAVEAATMVLRAGQDCVLTLAGEEGDRDLGAAGSRSLAAVTASCARFAGGLVMTGGQTARAVLEALSVRAVKLVREIRPGIALGHMAGPTSLAVAMKAGGFGDEDALVACRRAIRDAAPSALTSMDAVK